MARRRNKKIFSSLAKRATRGIYQLRGKRVVHFLHIGKTGGTAVKLALKPYRVTARYAITRHGHRQTLRQVPEGDGVIFFLRNPLTRFVSAFNSRLRQGEPRFSNPWTEGERAAFSEFNTPSRLAEALSAGDEQLRNRATAAMRSIGHVCDSYWKWFESEEYFLSRIDDVVFIGFQESLSKDFESLKTILGLPAALSLPSDEILAHKSPGHLDKNLSDLAAANLSNWYREDIGFFSQCKKYAGQVNQRLHDEKSLLASLY
jgi:hypothetical protein